MLRRPPSSTLFPYTTLFRSYALGRGYTAWARYDHNRIDLVPERANYKPGDTARIMIQSPWEQATALVTTERDRKSTRLNSSHPSISYAVFCLKKKKNIYSVT